MGRFNVVISPADPARGPAMMLETADIASALTVSDINLDQGTTQIFEGGREVVTLRKRGGTHAAYWEVAG